MRIFILSTLSLLFFCLALPAEVVKDFGKIYQSKTSNFFMPESRHEVQSIVQQALKEDKKISIGGAQMSQGGHIVPNAEDAFFISSKKLNQIEILPAEKVARVGPGATWEMIQDAAHPFGLAVQVMQASNIFSVGGSLSTNVHGWDHTKGTLAETVRSITIVDAAGNLVKLLPGDELFSLVAGGYGMFGIIVEVELFLTENSILKREGKIIPSSSYTDYYRKQVETNPAIRLHYGRLSLDPKRLFANVIAVDYTLTNEAYEVPLTLQKEPEKGSPFEWMALQLLRKSPHFVALKQQYDNAVYLKSKLMTRNEAMRPNIRFILTSNQNNADMLQEYFVPEEKLYPFLMELKNLIESHQVNLFNATIRHVKKDEISALPYAKDDVFAIVIYYNVGLDPASLHTITDFTQKSAEAVISFGGTYYLPYHRFQMIEQLEIAYPERQFIIEQRKLYDPTGLFSSQFADEYFEN